MVQEIPGLGRKKVSYVYNAISKVKQVAYQEGASDAFYHVYVYDADSRLSKVYTSTAKPTYGTNNLPDTTAKEQVSYTYYKHGPLKSVNLSKGLHTTEYAYTAQGWLKAINNPNQLDGNVFAEQLEYFKGDYTAAVSNVNYSTPIKGVTVNTGKDRYDGIAKAMSWKSKRMGINEMFHPAAYVYSYDKRYQLTSAISGFTNDDTFIADADSQYVETGMNYDHNGNILNLKRYGHKQGYRTPLVHNFTGSGEDDPGYHYLENSNKLASANGYASYSYNVIGQMTSQTFNETSVTRNFSYNASGLMDTVLQGGHPLINYTYNAGGQLAVKNHYKAGTDTIVATIYYVRDASGNILATYSQTPGDTTAEFPVYGLERLGHYTKDGETYVYQYELKDHLGNVRALIKPNSFNMVVQLSYADFYPYGSRMLYSNDLARITTYGYQGENAEYESEIGQNFFELRLYDPVTARWNSLDPQGQFYSGYVGMGNSPVMHIDPNGAWTFKEFWMSFKSWFGGNNEKTVVENKPVSIPGSSLYSTCREDSPDLIQDEAFIESTNRTSLAMDIGGGIFGALEGTATPEGKWLGINGKYYNNSWGGNQYTGSRSGAFAAASRYKWAGRGTLAATVVVGGVNIYSGYRNDGGQFGYNTQVAVASTSGSLVGGWLGSEGGAVLGAAVGVWFGGVGAIPGAIIGGFLGGLGGGYFGGTIGEGSVNAYYDK